MDIFIGTLYLFITVAAELHEAAHYTRVYAREHGKCLCLDAKEQFRQWEAARRQRFNKGLEKLRLVLPDCDPKTKVEIIHSAIEYIQESKAFKENILAGNEAQELKRVIRRLRKQVEVLKQRNAILVKLLQETGLRIESDASGGEIIYTTPGTCVQSNCSNASCKKVTCGTRIPVLLGDLSSEAIDDALEEDDAVNSGDLQPRDPTEKIAPVSSIRTQQPVFTEQGTGTQENTDASDSPENSGNKQGGKPPSVESSPENASEASLPARNSSDYQDEDVGVSIPAVSDEGTAQALVPPQERESESPRIASRSENAGPVSALSHNFVSAQLTSLSIESENEHISVLPQNCASDLKCEKTKEKILVEEVSKNGTITVSIIEEEGTQTEEASNNGSSKLSNRKLDGEGSDKTMGTAKELSLASSETCLVVQDMQHVTVHPEIQPQSIPATQAVPVSASNFYGNPTQMVTIQVHGGEKVQNKGQKVVLLQCGNSAPGTFQLVPPIADNSQLTYVTPSLSGVPIMSTGVPPSILQTGNLVKVVNSPPVLLLPPQPMISSLPHATKLKPIAPKPCSCKPVTSSQTKDVSGGIIASLPKNQGQVSPMKKDLVHTPSKTSTKVKRPLSLERNNGKAAKRSKGEFSADLPTIPKVPADIQPLQSSSLTPKTVTVNQVELASEDGEDLQEISTTTLTGLVHSAGIMDCVGEDALGNIMDIPVDMPCVMTENIRSSGIEPSNPTDDRLVEMLRSIDESDPRACEFSPPSSPVNGTDPLVEQAKGPEVQDETVEVSSGEAENNKICEENQAIPAKGNEPSSVTLENQQDVGAIEEECSVPTSSCTSAESSVTSNSYSITALCLSSRPLKEQSLLKDFGKASVSSSASTIHSSDVESVAQRTPVTVSAETTDLTRVSTPLVLPSTSGEYYLSKTPLPSREHLPKAASAPTYDSVQHGH
ncbi:mucin-17-like [Penaeus chinensis]|uniref:mucin-17-like n=1 Tax=Penaeus chinensis TaxID=139456 RepID=UPI001FB6D9F3|nr:mucin-17-like [Penaeus chinensis]